MSLFTFNSLRSVLKHPDRFSRDAIITRILKKCCKNYNCPVAVLKTIGKTTDESAPGILAAQITADAIISGDLTEEQQVVGYFQTAFDNRLLTAYLEGKVLQQRVEKFWDQCFRTYLDASEFKQACRDSTTRLAAFTDAEADFFVAISVPSFKFKHSAVALFQSIYYRNCIDQLRHHTSYTERVNREFVDMVLTQLPRSSIVVLQQPPEGLYGFDLAVLQRDHPDCYQLIYDRQVHHYTYAAMAEMRAKSEKQIRTALANCLTYFQSTFGG